MIHFLIHGERVEPLKEWHGGTPVPMNLTLSEVPWGSRSQVSEGEWKVAIGFPTLGFIFQHFRTRN